MLSMQTKGDLTVRWLIGLVVGSGVALAAATTLMFTAIHVFVGQPAEIYYSLYHNDWSLLNARALKMASAEEFKKAEDALRYRTTLADYHNNPLPYFLLGELENFGGNAKQAIAHYNTALSVINQDWYNQVTYQHVKDGALGALAVIYYERKDNKRSREALGAIMNMEAQPNASTLKALSDVLDDPERGDFRFELAKQLKLDLKLLMARQELDQALALSDDPQLKWEIKNFLRVKMPAVSGDLSPMARYYALAGNARRRDGSSPMEAIQLYELALQEAPGCEWLYHHLALTYLELKNYKKAHRYATQAAALNPNFYLPVLTMGDIALEEKNYSQAVDHFKRAAFVVGQLRDQAHQELLANIDNQIGFAYELMNDSDSALAFYRQALETATEESADRDYALTAIQRIEESTGSVKGKRNKIAQKN
jgi:tetratricopeptide (TPR) repeat protein